MVKMSGSQHFDGPNVERQICRNFEIKIEIKISNIKITKVELLDFFIFEFIFYFYVRLNCSSNTQNTYMIIYEIGSLWNFDSFTNYLI